MTPPTQLSSARRGDRPRAHAGTSETETAIFAATERLLASEPLQELSVADIMAEAGISRATFYFYFSSKFAVVVGLLAKVMDEMFGTVRPYVNRPEDVTPEASLHASIAAGVELWSRHRPAMRAIHEHWSTIEELRGLWLDVMDRFTTALADQIDRDRASGITPPGPDSRSLAASLLWSTESCLYVAGLGADPSFADETQALEPLFALWRGALVPAAVPSPVAPKRRGATKKSSGPKRSSSAR